MTAAPQARAFIQARMSSRRFPGKVLAPLRGRPLIALLVSRVARAVPHERITVLTSYEPADDPLAAYLRQQGLSVFRGPLEDVFSRFRSCLAVAPCEWFFRVCADSPLLDGALLETLASHARRSDVDLVTNVYPRTFPRGQSVEMLRASTFAAIDPAGLNAHQREHVTTFYYENPQRFRILNVESGDPSLAAESLAVDTAEDLLRLEALLEDPSRAAEAVRAALENAR